jgi:hypothetical protein
MAFVAVGLLGYATGILPPIVIADSTVSLLLELTLALLLFTDATKVHVTSWETDMELPTRLLAIGMPLTIGKLDLHYTGEGVYGTILLWDEASRRLRPAVRQKFIRALLNELSQPMGVPNEFVVEFFAPKLDGYELFHNVGVEDDEENEAGR